MTIRQLILVIFGALAVSNAGFAQDVSGLDSDKPIEISADELEVVQPDQQAIFRGNVIASQGAVTLKSDTMRVFYRNNESRNPGMGAVSKIEVNSRVQLATPEESASADKGFYFVDKEQIMLLGNVILTRGKNILKGQQLDYNLKSGKSLLTGGVQTTTSGDGKKQRVKGVFVPNQ